MGRQSEREGSMCVCVCVCVCVCKRERESKKGERLLDILNTYCHAMATKPTCGCTALTNDSLIRLPQNARDPCF